MDPQEVSQNCIYNGSKKELEILIGKITRHFGMKKKLFKIIKDDFEDFYKKPRPIYRLVFADKNCTSVYSVDVFSGFCRGYMSSKNEDKRKK